MNLTLHSATRPGSRQLWKIDQGPGQIPDRAGVTADPLLEIICHIASYDYLCHTLVFNNRRNV